jgi:hypothetical protein
MQTFIQGSCYWVKVLRKGIYNYDVYEIYDRDGNPLQQISRADWISSQDLDDYDMGNFIFSKMDPDFVGKARPCAWEISCNIKEGKCVTFYDKNTHVLFSTRYDGNDDLEEVLEKKKYKSPSKYWMTGLDLDWDWIFSNKKALVRKSLRNQ